MSLQPIDLQALFLHMNQPAKDQAVTRESVVQAQAAQAAKLVEQADQVQNDVTPTTNDGDNDLKIQDKENHEGSSEREKKKKQNEEETSQHAPYFVDDRVGKKIDVTG